MIARNMVSLAVLLLTALPARSEIPDPGGNDLAALFGAPDSILDISLSPDGKHIAYITPGPKGSTVVMIANTSGNGVPMQAT